MKEPKDLEKSIVEDLYFYCKGYKFNYWIDNPYVVGRNNGHNYQDLIQTPGYIVESLLRDEQLVERDLEITTKDGAHLWITVDKLNNTTDDFYNTCFIQNVTRNDIVWVSDYDGATKKLYLDSARPSYVVGDKIYLTNVQGNNFIDFAGFDIVGNTTNGLRKDWICSFSQNEEIEGQVLINEIMKSSFLMLRKSGKKYNLVALDTAVSGDTWTTPLKQGGREMFSASLTSVDEVYTEYRLKYYYHYGSKKFEKEYFVNESGKSSAISSATQTKCINAVATYRRKKKLEFETKYIRHDATAVSLIEKLVEWSSFQKLDITWGGEIKTYIKYEIGDQVKINNTNLIPTGKNNSTYFMIYSKKIVPIKGQPFIEFKLLEMP